MYTLVMIDPDVPSRKEPKLKEWYYNLFIKLNLERRHWVVVNIPQSRVNKGEVDTSYLGPGFMKNS
jgi:phosphatidylethanolamine-binding protein (PEBP) family uncharacterized protein